jgi:hypothetical protein
MKQGSKKAVTFLKKSNQQTFTIPRPLSGHSLAAQRPGTTKSFLLLFFKKEALS